jgi:hypothetical protein
MGARCPFCVEIKGGKLIETERDSHLQLDALKMIKDATEERFVD